MINIGFLDITSPLMIPQRGQSQVGGGDANWGNVSLRLPLDTNFTDASTNAHIVTAEGDCQIVTSEKKYGAGSAQFDNVGDRFSIPTHTSLDLNGVDSTVEFWFYPFALGTYDILYSNNTSGTNFAGFELLTQSDGSLLIIAPSTTAASAASLITTGSWYHIAVVRESTTTKVYLGGIERISTSLTYVNGQNWYWGDRVTGAGSGQYPMHGYIDDIRITKGVARYTTAFTPPTEAYPTS